MYNLRKRGDVPVAMRVGCGAHLAIHQKRQFTERRTSGGESETGDEVAGGKPSGAQSRRAQSREDDTVNGQGRRDAKRHGRQGANV